MTPALKLPPGPKGIPFLGCGPRMARDPLGFMTHFARDFGDIAAARFGTRLLYSVNHPDLIEELYLGRHRDCIKDSTTRELLPLIGEGLLTSDGDTWRRQRKLASPPLQPKRIEAYAKTMVECTARHVARFRADEVRDVHAEMMQLTLEIVGETLLGFDTRRDADRVSAALEDIVAYYEARLFSLRGLLPHGFPSLAQLRFKRAIKVLDAVVYRMIARCRSTESERDHLLARLLRAQGEDGAMLTDLQARNEAMTMLLAGHETTALALGYALLSLSWHPECEQRLREELAQLGDAEPTLADLNRLPYLDAVIRETLRLYPPAYAFGRQVETPFSLGGYDIPKGAELMTSPYALHRDSRFFPQPERFMPERWLDASTQANLPRYAYIPFGLGPRICIGNHFAKMELALVLATLLQQVSLHAVPGFRLELIPVITLRPRRGVPMIVGRLRTPPVQVSHDNPSLTPPWAAHA